MRRQRWVRFILLSLGLLVAASWGISGALQYGWGRRSLLARLSVSFGRPVEAGRFSFSLLRGPRLEVNSVTVAEDSRFGQEYFLRAEQLTASLRWPALFRGRIEFDTLSLTRPSLNLVHAPSGQWNVESWLPPVKEPAAARPQGTVDAIQVAPSAVQKQLWRIEINGGRINFKRGQEKLLFALGDVRGRIDRDGAGRWSLDLQAHPMRASVALQDAGTLRLRGTASGTSARLRPAALALTWEDASLADALRLVTGQDWGVRGSLGAEFSAKIEDLPARRGEESSRGKWTIAGKMRLAGVHRWDLAARSSDPAVNVSATAVWRPGTPTLEIEHGIIEAPHSQLLATGTVDWMHGLNPNVRLVSSGIAFEDLLGWRRSFHPNFPDDLAVDGAVGLQAAVVGWPLRIEQASLSSTGAVVRLGTSSVPVRVGPISAALRRNSLMLKPVSVSLMNPAVAGGTSRSGVAEAASAPAGELHVEGSLGPLLPGVGLRDWPYRLAVSGRTARAQDLMAVVDVFARSANNEWKLEGPAIVKLAWSGVQGHGLSPLVGRLELRGAQLTSAVLNQPLTLSSAIIELRPDGRRVKLNDAQALGAHWRGTLDQRVGDRIWHIDLTADRLDAADLDRWLGPRARPSFLERLLPFAVSSSEAQTRNAAIERLSAQGRLRVGEISLSPIRVEKLEAAVELTGRKLTVRRAQAQFFDGRVAGDFEALLSADPAYTFRGEFDRVNLASLASSTASLGGHFAGLASGELSLTARGVGKARLLESLAGQGDLRVRDAVLRGLDFPSVGQNDNAAEGADESGFATATAGFHIAGGRIRVEQLSLTARDARFEIQGSVNLTRQLDLRAWSEPHGVDVAPGAGPAAERREWTIGGTLDAPLLTRQTRLAGNRMATDTPSGPSPAPR